MTQLFQQHNRHHSPLQPTSSKPNTQFLLSLPRPDFLPPNFNIRESLRLQYFVSSRLGIEGPGSKEWAISGRYQATYMISVMHTLLRRSNLFSHINEHLVVTSLWGRSSIDVRKELSLFRLERFKNKLWCGIQRLYFFTLYGNIIFLINQTTFTWQLRTPNSYLEKSRFPKGSNWETRNGCVNPMIREVSLQVTPIESKETSSSKKKGAPAE